MILDFKASGNQVTAFMVAIVLVLTMIPIPMLMAGEEYRQNAAQQTGPVKTLKEVQQEQSHPSARQTQNMSPQNAAPDFPLGPSLRGKEEIVVTPEDREKIRKVLAEEFDVDPSKVDFGLYKMPEVSNQKGQPAAVMNGIGVDAVVDEKHYVAEVFRESDADDYQLIFIQESSESYLNLRNIVNAINHVLPAYEPKLNSVKSIAKIESGLKYLSDPRFQVGNQITTGNIVTLTDGRKFAVIRGVTTTSYDSDWRGVIEMEVSFVLQIPKELGIEELNAILDQLNKNPNGGSFLLSGLKSIKLFTPPDQVFCEGTGCLMFWHEMVVDAQDDRGMAREFVGGFGKVFDIKLKNNIKVEEDILFLVES